MDPISVGLIGASILFAMGLGCVAGLKGWQAWLDFKRLELADLKERVRKLEAIAAGIDI